MAVTHYVTTEDRGAGGEKLVRGKLTIGSTGSSGTAALNLANYFMSNNEITLICDAIFENSANSAYLISANVANAEVITLQAKVPGLGTSEPFYAANAGLELTAGNIGFIAMGRARVDG